MEKTNKNVYMHELPDPEYCPDSTSHKHEWGVDGNAVAVITMKSLINNLVNDEWHKSFRYCVWCGVIES